MDEQSIFLDPLNKPAGDERNAWLDEFCGKEPVKRKVSIKLWDESATAGQRREAFLQSGADR